MSGRPRILVTRPSAEAKTLIAALEAQNFATVLLPTIDIHPIDNTPAVRQAFSSADKIIFISRNAVKQVATVALKELKKFSGEILAIGSGTAAELYAINIKEVIYPPSEFNSEALLELPELDDVLDKEIVIFSGLGGRDLLAQTLVERGADVTKVATYERKRPNYDATHVTTALDNLACIISTSSENLQHLIQLGCAAKQSALFNTPLLVVSKGMVELARKNGFSNTIIIAANPSDNILVETLYQWMKTNQPPVM